MKTKLLTSVSFISCMIGAFFVAPSASTAAQFNAFTLNPGLSYRLYDALNISETTNGGNVLKSVVTPHVRLDCYRLPRYVCTLGTDTFVLQTGPRDQQTLKVTDKTGSEAIFKALNVAPSSTNTKTVAYEGTSVVCSSSACDIVLRAASPEPLPVPTSGPRPPTCHTHTEGCSYYGYCYQSSTGTFDYGWCYGVREVGCGHVGECR